MGRNYSPSRNENPRVATSLSTTARCKLTVGRSFPPPGCAVIQDGDVRSTPVSGHLALLVGLLLTDGSVSSKGRGWVIEFTGKSKELHSLFKKIMRDIFGDVKFTQFRDSRYRDVIKTKVTSKRIGEYLLTLIPTFRTKQLENGKFPNSRIPKFVFKLPKIHKIRMLQVMFSCDGSISLWVVWNKRYGLWEIKKWVKFACKHPTIRRQVYALLRELGFEPIIRPENDEVLLIKKKDIKKFARTIRFIPSVRVTGDSKNWEGYEKNKVLDIAVRSYEVKQLELKKFKTKPEIMAFLKRLA